jgi:DNA-binding NtrC family response regulator
MKEKPTLLIVDDDKDLLRQLEFLLEDDFEKIMLSSSKNEALQVDLEKIDVCLVDIRLSETDPKNTEGLELAKEIRCKNCPTVVVVMSRYGTEKYEDLNKKENFADGFIRKPFTMDEFIELIARIKEVKGAD